MIKCTAIFDYISNRTGNVGAYGGILAQSRKGGWSESIYHSGSISEARTDFLDVCALRARLIPEGTSIQGQRYEDTNGGSATGGEIFQGNRNLEADVPQMALRLTCNASNNVNTRKWDIRGIPDSYVTEGEFSPTTNYRLNVMRYAQKLCSGSFRFLGRVLTGDVAFIYSVTTGGLCTTADSIDPTPGMMVRAVRVKDVNGNSITGAFRVIERTEPGIFTIQGWPQVAANEGGFRIVASDFFPMDPASVSIRGIVVRKVGAPFLRYRGRQSARRR